MQQHAVAGILQRQRRFVVVVRGALPIVPAIA
jgi:hypothetical protein